MTYFENLKGVYPALVTPLDKKGKIDEKTLRKLVNRTIEGGVNGLVILGTTGEGPVLERSEKYRAIEVAVEESDGRVHILAGTGDINTQAVKENNRQVAKLGAYSALVIPPFYFPQNKKTVINFFKDIAQSSPIPIIIYNFPQISKIYLEPDSVEILTKEENIVGIKDSSANFINFQHCLNYQSDDFLVYQGVGALNYASLLLGSGGLISPVGNIDPVLEVDLYKAVTNGDMDKAKILQQKINKLISLWRNSDVPAPAVIKALLGIIGISDTYTSSPNPKIEGENLDLLRKKYNEAIG